MTQQYWLNWTQSATHTQIYPGWIEQVLVPLEGSYLWFCRFRAYINSFKWEPNSIYKNFIICSIPLLCWALSEWNLDKLHLCIYIYIYIYIYRLCLSVLSSNLTWFVKCSVYIYTHKGLQCAVTAITIVALWQYIYTIDDQKFSGYISTLFDRSVSWGQMTCLPIHWNKHWITILVHKYISHQYSTINSSTCSIKRSWGVTWV